MNNFTAIILAAGAGTRMKSTIPKALQEVCGRSMIDHVIDSAKSIGCKNIIVVTGCGRELVEKHLSQRNNIDKDINIRFAFQENRLGTGDAVKMAVPFIKDEENILILCADTPLLKTESLKALMDSVDNNISGAVLTSIMEDATGYGRILRDNGDVAAIIEHKDATSEQLNINEINTGVYAFKGAKLKHALGSLNNDNAQGEYYLTDVISILKGDGHRITAVIEDEPHSTLGVNSPHQLHQANRYMQTEIVNRHMTNGVQFINADTVVIEKKVKIGSDTVIYPNVVLRGNTEIGQACHIGMSSRIENSVISDNVSVESSVILDSKVGSGTSVGPFAYMRPNSVVGKNVKVGDFVEIKNSTLGDDTKVSHLSYIGDGDVGNRVNVGCGVVFVNYDGVKKHRTVVADDVFIGCNANLVSPVNISEGSYVAAGTTVTRDIPKDTLTVGRVRQENKEGRASLLKRMKSHMEGEK